MENSSLYRIWSIIVQELANLQDRACDSEEGHVINPISWGIYKRDTAFASAIFAVEFQRSKKEEWRHRAYRALKALGKSDIYQGVEEPIWNRYGWHSKKGSLAATGMLLDAVWDTSRTLNKAISEEEFEDILAYLEKCYLGKGLFAHDQIESGAYLPSPVQNTTGMALYLLEYIIKYSQQDRSKFLEKRESVWQALFDGQRSDGFWPYIYPGQGQQFYYDSSRELRFILRKIPFLRSAVLKQGDSSIFFGDGVHHCLVLYYLLKAADLQQPSLKSFTSILGSGWNWTCQHLKEAKDGTIKFDFEWEPKIASPRYCNFRDTSTYFFILGCLPILMRQGILNQISRYKFQEGILGHIEANLIQKSQQIYPSIKPYEGEETILKNILPRVAESVAQKGFCLCSLILEKIESEKILTLR